MTEEKRQKTVKIRTTEKEYSALLKRSEKPRLAEWMREYCLGAKENLPSRVPAPEVDPQLLRQLAGVGNNLNQIARSLHSKLEPIDRVHVMAQLAAIEDTLAQIREDHQA